jgi:hypothetical protein
MTSDPSRVPGIDGFVGKPSIYGLEKNLKGRNRTGVHVVHR